MACRPLLRSCLTLPVTALALSGYAEAGNNVITNAAQDAVDIAATDTGLRSGNFIVAPIPFSNDTVGSGLVLGAGYLFSLPGSRPSGVGFGGFKTDNGSVAYGLGGSVVFDENKWTLGAFLGEGDINYDLPIAGDLVLPLSQQVAGGAVRLEYGFSDQLKAGGAIAYLDSSITLGPGSSIPEFLRPDLEVDLFRLSFDVVHDTRDNTFYPTQGTYLSLSLGYGHIEDALFEGRLKIDERDYPKIVGKGSAFWDVGDDAVLGANATLCGTSSDAPFFDTCGVGFADGLRGFSTLGALANYSASAQVEYRGRLSERFGYVVFAGTGAGGDEIGDLSFDNGGLAGGVGLRIRLSKDFGLDYAIDYARNLDDEEFVYLSLGQKF